MYTYEEKADALLGQVFDMLSLAIDGMEGRDAGKLMIGAAMLCVSAQQLAETLSEAGYVTDLGGVDTLPPFFAKAV